MESYLGEIRMFAGNFAPEGWALCNGQLLSISVYEDLFALMGTTYGGDGQSTFALPDLRGRLPVHRNGNSILLGSQGGTETVTLVSSQLPVHSHASIASSEEGTEISPMNAIWAKSNANYYSKGSGTQGAMHPEAISSAGGSQPHNNMMPSLTISFIISLYGIYPTSS